MEWQPIETAPQDCSRILGRRTEVDRWTGKLRYQKRITWWAKTSHLPLVGWNYGRDVENHNLWEPTHWRPLPSPPRSAQEPDQETR